MDWVKTKVNFIAVIFCVLSACLWMATFAKGYYDFYNTGDWDLANIAQFESRLLHGDVCPTIWGSNIFGDHCHFFICLFGLVYWIFPQAIFLQYLKTAAFFSGAYILFLILKKKFHPLIALGGMVVFTLLPANIGLLKFLFNTEAFAIPLVFLMFKSFDEEKYPLFILSCVLLAMVKEQMPLLVMMFGFFAFFMRKTDRIRWALIPFLMGMLIFITEVFVLIPYFRQDLPISHFSLRWADYAKFGASPMGILSFLLTHPSSVWAQMTCAEDIHWYNDLFGVWGGLAFLSPQILFMALPVFLQISLSNGWLVHDIFCYHSAILTPFIFLAAWNTLDCIDNKHRLLLHSIFLAVIFVNVLVYVPQWRDFFEDRPVTTKALALRRLIDEIPAQASVLSDKLMLPHLTDRRYLYWVGDYLNGGGGWERRIRYPARIDYLLLDRDDCGDGDVPKYASLVFDGRWSLKDSIEDTALFTANAPFQTPRRLIERNDKPFLKTGPGKALVSDHAISLEGINFPRQLPQSYRIFPVTMYWQCLQSSAVYYLMEIRITRGGKTYYLKQRRIGSWYYPTRYWHEGEYIKEKYFYLLPRLRPDKYFIEIKIYGPPGDQWKNGRDFISKEFFVVP